MTQPPLPPRRSQTVLGTLTQAVKTTFTRIDFSKLKLKPNARVPELLIQDADAPKAQVFPLLGDRYTVGRSSKSCDIVVRNPVVSQVHAVIKRDRKRKFLGLPTRSRFVIRDEGSTNGMYRGKRKLKSTILYNGDIITLGPPELAAAVRVQYKDPLPWYLKAVRYGLFGISGLSAIATLAIAFEWQRFSVYPLPESVQGPVVVNSRDGQPLRTPRTDRHIEIQNLSEFSPYLPRAVMASEDSRYYWHFGVDPIGTLRAVVTNVRGGEIREGGSTITQQLARSVFPDYVGRQDSAARKIREAIVSLKLETVYSKNFLLRMYLNRVYLGSGIYGFEDAAQFYFGKASKDLTLSEAATLVGILPAPNSFNPVTNYKAAVEYRDRVLERMAQQGMVSQEEADRARRSRIEISPKARQELQGSIAPYFYSAVFDELDSLLGGRLAREGNFIVETGLDRKMQAAAERSLKNSVETNGASAGYSQGAVVTIDAKTGAVLALVGGVDYQESQFNRVTQALRQPGSTFKIFAYAAALEQGISPGTTYSCAPLNWGGQTFAGCSGGGDFYTGMAQSLNVVALRVAQDVGLDKVVQMAQRMGVQSTLKAVPGLVLGQSETTPLEMTSAFGVLANEGVRNRPHTIKRIIDSGDCQNRQDISTCRVIYQADQDSENNAQVIQPEVANTMTTLLRGVVQSGTGRSAAIGLGEVGKTGTTNDNKDLWFIGYVPSQKIVTGVWLGNDDNKPTDGNSGLAAKLWGDYMRQVVR
ncbi:penicillin-binding protein [Leptolyngbya boryana NIES-2135]|jgi:1A family penicillin-binding protein|uniref:Penicillin-binding protein n=1 Tax=Leptolyngbya boryana NIES-2135 TaxID=1973484 RepID=A0A1Z4JCH7_LEPBY|nr:MULTISPECIES: PBP1A family penicillin-binding protein [Leptolyngbya]BAY54452.1 penicillin-binding protein [Leptolyngbya boryana NIES-2135]MBD2370040.1 PBP1A family penicillin-binding protein [Leptolyngbya sp. FACHB-161]MBD2376493.1 PBP1A family penicillin-binding protein [Leptolyngbya sp. FACHB-238]MBD2400767.1 PBP1A family penicillin-binding protein [Leptolyngbya sp. FACHB-239]MBD2407310.1 PBP1A family penicillin-binding protein [Leptolyngbya sp. FACHB-402]